MTTVSVQIASLVGGILIWWLLSTVDDNFPSPPSVLQQAGYLLSHSDPDGTPILLAAAWASLKRVFIGFALGTILAIPIGFLMGWYVTARNVLDPWIQFFRTVPPLALIPLVLVLLGIGESAKIFVIAVAAFLVAVISTYQGVVNVDRTLINAARVLGAGDSVIFARVVVPASAPFILVGMRVGLGSAWGTLVAAELIAAQEGLGYRMQTAQLYGQTSTIVVALIVIGLLGFLMDRVLLAVERRLTSWQERRAQ
jgi:NitT/TauT family transport system permease protein